MPASPGYVRLAASSARSLASTAFDSVRDALLVINLGAKHLPVVLANAAARKTLLGESHGDALLDTPLFGLLAPGSASVLSAALPQLSEGRPCIETTLTWRVEGGRGSITALTEAMLLSSGPASLVTGSGSTSAAAALPAPATGDDASRLVMLGFSPTSVASGLSQALDCMPFELVLVDRELRVIYANAGAVASCASSHPAGIVGTSALELAPASSLPPEVFKRALQGHGYRSEAVEVRAPVGPARCFQIDVQPLRGASGIVGLMIRSSPACDPQRTPGALQRASNLKTLTENARDIITVLDPQGRILYLSGGVRNALGYGSDERPFEVAFGYVHPDDLPTLKTRFDQLVGGEIPRFSMEYRVYHKDGRYRWLDAIYVSALADPSINGIIVNSRDITERKEVESRLAQREEIFRMAAEAVEGIVYEWDITKGISYRSSGVYEMLGLEPQDLPPSVDAWRERVHPSDLGAALCKINLALINGRGWTCTYRVRDARGRYRCVLERGLVQRNANGDPMRAIGCMVDISEVRRLSALLEDTQRAAQTGGWEYSFSTRELMWTDEMFRIFDTSRDSFVVSWEAMLAQCTAESRQRFHEAIVQAEAGEGYLDLELEIVTLKSQRIWVRMIGHLEMLDGHPFRAYGSMQNVQAQKLAQLAVENSRDWLKLSMHMAQMHAWRWDKASDEIEYAVAEGRQVTMPAHYPTLQVVLGRVHPQDRSGISSAIEQSFKYQREIHVEFRLKEADGRYGSYVTVAQPLFDAAGAPRGLVGVTQDVSARRESELRLRRSEQLLRDTTANTADTLILVDTDLRIRFINRNLGGRTLERMVGADIAEVLPLNARPIAIARLRTVLHTGEAVTHEFECEAEAWDGWGPEPQFLELRAVLVRDERVPTGISISVRNNTERKRLEQEILDVAARERNTIGRDLHDGLGQELTGVALMLRGLATRLQREAPAVIGQVNEVVRHVNQSIESTRALARGLLPVRTDSGGLPFALRALAGRSRDLFGLEVNFRAELRPDITLGETSASHLYRIAQEALTNAARHGRASKVEIFLSVTNKNFALCITDDGVGMSVPSKPGSGMGLKIMRYRAGMIGAKFEIVPNAPRGTKVRVTGEQPEVVALPAGHGSI